MPRISAAALLGIGTAIGLASPPAFATKITAVQESSWGQATAGKYDVTASPVGVGDSITAAYTLPTPGSKPITVSVGRLNQSMTWVELRGIGTEFVYKQGICLATH
jgi:hypothetical protein